MTETKKLLEIMENVEEGETIYAAPNGYPGAASIETNPLDLQTALNHAQPGQTIVMLDGTYFH